MNLLSSRSTGIAMEKWILGKMIINMFSLIIHSCLLLMISCTPSLHSSSFDALFFSQNFGDMVAVILRVLTKYAPVLILRNHSGVIEVDKNTFPLATLTNAAEWYTNYVIIFSALVFSMDRAVMAVSMTNYSWFCNSVFKICLVIMTWLVPIAWVLPMLDPCCRSQYYGGRIDLVEMENPQADSTYDAIDMLFETLFYVPVLCFLNGFCMILMYSRWTSLMKQKRKTILDKGPVLPSISGLHEILCEDLEGGRYFPISGPALRKSAEERLLDRLDLELSFCIISIVDQQIDFFAVLFYTLYWASYSGYIEMRAGIFLEWYSYFFEFGTIFSPYILLIFCTNLRKEFFHRINIACDSCRYESEDDEE